MSQTLQRTQCNWTERIVFFKASSCNYENVSKVKVQPRLNVKVKPFHYINNPDLGSTKNNLFKQVFELNVLVNMRAVSSLRETNYTQDIKPQ